ncbi:uncharacterized protein LOC134649153 [Cydia amplana]|uniref:uncharacterized protein LOC134649153 n=1 Tax=Cydia amplana TaxID=1869771 RepID=UPI002FE5AF7B
MEFDLKSACSLIPLMDGTEETTKRLIDAVDMYSGMLNETGKKSLITFVLKGRLSESAKLRMSATYTTVEQLIRDLRNSLLPKKSFTAIHSRLQNISQGWRSIDQYGSEIEKLFSELTITQAEGNSASYDVLKPLNEKMCIKKFTDGLKDPRLSTIIAARNFSSLKDAIQAAQDEDVSRPTTSSQSEVMGMYRSQNSFNRYHRGFAHNSYRGHRHRNQRGPRQYSYGRYPQPQQGNSRGGGRGYKSRGRPARGGSYFGSRARGVTARGSLHVIRHAENGSTGQHPSAPNTESLNHFFRD